MATKVMTLEEIRAADTPEARAAFKRRMDATTEADVRRHMLEEGYDPDEDIPDEAIISPGFIRKRLGMSQAQFAAAIGVPIKTLQNWEQNRVVMEPSARALMVILAREPEVALRALAASGAA